MKTKTVVIGLIKNDKGEILLSLRDDPTVPKAHLRWDFPGGVIDFGETAEKALEREVLEETSLKVRVDKMIPLCHCQVWESDKYGKIHAIVLCYHCHLQEGEPQPKDPKIRELKWVKKADLAQYKLLSSIKRFMAAS